MDTPCRSDKETHSARGQVVRRVLFAPSPCSRGVASETRGCGGLVPRKAFSFGNFGHNQAKQRTLRANAANSREARGGIGDKREGGVPTAPPRRECDANLSG